MLAIQHIGQQDQSWSPDAHLKLVCTVVISSAACNWRSATDTMHSAGFALSQWYVQTKLSRKGDDLSTLTNQQVLGAGVATPYLHHAAMTPCMLGWKLAHVQTLLLRLKG